LTSALDDGQWLGSRHSRFTPRGRALGTHLIGSWVGPRDGVEEEKSENKLIKEYF